MAHTPAGSHAARLAVLVTAVALTGAALPATATAAAAPHRAPGSPTTTTVAYPDSMASTGDSITRAFDINWLHVLSDSPQYSWSTGSSTSVSSEYRRILAAHSAISGHAYNDAKTGAKMADLAGQLQSAATQQVQYVTVLMGANDLCTSSAATMTSTATFTDELQTALSAFVAADPNAKVFVSSIPNIYNLWYVLHTNASARSAWQTFGICQSMLASTNTETQRQLVVTQEIADNQALATVCAEFAQCRFDAGATYGVSFPASDVSTVDYFHPDIAGQNLLASTAWKAGYWG